eukprot:TRINITY_DN18687_c0_g1_i1.p1 TRINITY_DN18687_c0_g1~~TRINITY_DN18687_c0_g1_i1.p1  ORF type:complete len:140 (-),score=34.89 TRINITY_DN18687_c0_g1_i1:206-625(-)
MMKRVLMIASLMFLYQCCLVKATNQIPEDGEAEARAVQELEDYLEDYQDYQDLMEKRGGRRSLVDQMVALVKNLKKGELSVTKRARSGPKQDEELSAMKRAYAGPKQGILSYLYDLARKYKRGMRGDPRSVLYQYRRNY